MKTFQVGDVVAWSHELVARGIESMSRKGIEGQYATTHPRFGIVSSLANEKGTELEVTLEPIEIETAHGYGEPFVRVLTADELVKVEE
jgi:hypothetical protein